MDAPDPDELIAQLYALPLEEFTRARDALAKRMRTGGERDAATRVGAVRKPSLTAWAINRLRAREPEKVEELIAAGAQLRRAQAHMIASGDPAPLRDAVARERELVQGLAERAAAELSASGRAAGETARSRIFATLHAAAADDEVRELLAAGRLVRDYELSDLGLGLGAGADMGSVPEGSASTTRPIKRPKQADRDLARARKQLEQAIGARVSASEDVKAAESSAQAAEAALADAREQSRRATAAVDEAEAALARARKDLEEARARSDQARELVTARERAVAASGG